MKRDNEEVMTVAVPYDPGLSLRLAEAAIASYYDGDALARFSARRGYVCQHWSEGAAQAAVFCDQSAADGALIVAMRGTDSGMDWRVDTRFLRVRRSWWGFPSEDGKVLGTVHRGFVAYAERLSALIAEEVERWPGRPIHVCGHSLGGALSYLIARHLWRRGRRIATVHAFSSPRVGNREWAQAYDASALGAVTYRVIVVLGGEQDLITQTPPAWMGYWHAGRPVIVTGTDRYESGEAWETVRKGLPMRWRYITRLIRSIRAHPANLLLSVLRTNANVETRRGGEQ